MKLPKEIWMCENEQARWYEYEQPYDLPNDVTVTKMVPAQSEQKPVAYINIEERKLEWAYKYMSWDTPTVINLPKIPLYTTPPQRTWVGLTDKEIDAGLLRTNYAMQTAGAWRDGVEWATKQLKERNT